MPMVPHRLVCRIGTGALTALVACACGDDTDLAPAVPRNVAVQVSLNVPTVVSVSWATDQASTGYVEYGPTPDMAFSTPMQPLGTQHRANLLGLTPGSVYYYRVVTWMGHNAGASAQGTVQTGTLPLALPTFTAQGTDQTQLIVTSLVGQSTVAVLNPFGQVVWALNDAKGLDVYRALPSIDGASMLYNVVGAPGAPADNSALVRAALDGSSEVVLPYPRLGIDFVERADGTLAAIAVDERDFQGTLRRGDKIVEFAPDGTTTDVWSTWDCFDPATVPGGAVPPAWTTANALDFVESEQAYYVGLRDLGSIVKVDRATRACQWVLGTAGATLAFAEGAEPFSQPSQFHVFNSGGKPHVLLFDGNGVGGVPRVLEYELDVTQQTATMVLNLPAPAGLAGAVLGEPQRISGATFVNWSAGHMQRFDRDGLPLWQLSADGVVFGYYTMVDNLYSGPVRAPSGTP